MRKAPKRKKIMSDTTLDVVALTRDLIRCPSVTPLDAGALAVLAGALESLGFTCHRMTFEAPDTPPVDNLYARLGNARPNFCFAGHTDVVPVGDAAGWARDPFSAEVSDGVLYGRGASDMKGAVAAFAAAVSQFLAGRASDFDGSISLLITGDEEGPAINGTRKVLDWMAMRGEEIDVCLVGEPTNPGVLGDMVKIGRRGSLTCSVTVTGTQGHVAYPHLADNPATRLVRMLDAAINHRLDDGTDHFQPTNLEITSIDIGNPATNVIPAHAEARFNIRFNDLHTGDSLLTWLNETFAAAAGPDARWRLDHHLTGEAFLTPPGPLSDLIAGAVESVTGQRPELSTTGGTSDARFIKNVCPVTEFGLVGKTMHKTDECVAIADLEQLTAVYRAILERYFQL
jgi:succinyl-diaminopimelate desuccinylase